MAEASDQCSPHALLLGHIVVTESPDNQYQGGYLCTDKHGAPTDFWYTTRVQPSRLQELLYGKVLRPQLLGRHIAGALVSGLEQRPTVILTEDEAILTGLQDEWCPVVCVRQPLAGEETGQHSRKLQCADREVLLSWRGKDHDVVESLLPALEGVDLIEPFERIRGVLHELANVEPPEASPE
jgi:hypothetical protein